MWTRAQYLDRVGLSIDPEAMAKIEKAEEFFSSVGIKTFDNMFIGNQINEDQVPRFGTLWYFTKQLIYFVPRFRATDEQYVVTKLESIVDCGFELTECDFSELTSKSRLSVKCNLGPKMSVRMNAAGENCLQLFEIAKAFLMPPMANC